LKKKLLNQKNQKINRKELLKKLYMKMDQKMKSFLSQRLVGKSTVN
jgi:hypothetical protein